MFSSTRASLAALFHIYCCVVTLSASSPAPESVLDYPAASSNPSNATAFWTEVKEERINRVHHVPEAKCHFSIHEKGPSGKEVSGTTLNQELYYRIKCEPYDGYCLVVSNCSVSAGRGAQEQQKPYAIIDENGCTKEPSLFEHVSYEQAFTAGIYNPFPIR